MPSPAGRADDDVLDGRAVAPARTPGPGSRPGRRRRCSSSASCRRRRSPRPGWCRWAGPRRRSWSATCAVGGCPGRRRGPTGGPVDVGGVVDGGVVPDDDTTTSSNEADENAVCRPIRPLAIRLLLAEPTCVPSMVPRIVVPLTSMARVYQVPADTVRDRLPSTVTELPLTACSSTRFPVSRASR